jgi:O-antigen/teichoic acid export membrane protein
VSITKKKALVGIIWSAIERFSTQGVQFILSIFLARILSPKDFGLIAMVMVFLVVLDTINETGFGAALIQKQDRDDVDYSTVFIFNLVLGFFLYFFLFLFAPQIADFYGNQELIIITRILGLNLVISSLIVVQRAILIIKIDFKTQAKASFVAALLSGCIGIYLAYQGWGVWAIVCQTLISNLINLIMIWYMSKWVPKFLFSYTRFKTLFSFSYKLILSRLINVVFQNLYPLIIGKYFSVIQLGYYSKAKGFSDLPSSNITGIIQKVSTPFICENQEDLPKMRSILSKFMLLATLITFPIMVGMIILAKPLITVLLTEKWLPAAYMLQLLCPIGMLYVLNTFNMNIFNAIARTDLALKVEIIKKGLVFISIILSVPYGIKVLLICQIIATCIELVINAYLSKKLIGYGLFQQFNNLKGVIFSSVVMGIVVFITVQLIDTSFLKLLVGCIAGAIVYTLLIVNSYSGSLKEVRSTFNNLDWDSF